MKTPSNPLPTVLEADQARGAQARLLYSYTEAREQLGGVPQSTWSMWIAQGLVVPVRIGPRRCFVKREDLVRLAQGDPTQKVS